MPAISTKKETEIATIEQRPETSTDIKYNKNK